MVMRGKAEPGDKTMCDAWWPVVESLGQSAQQNLSVAEALQRAADSAERAVESTITMQARKGGPVTWASAASATRSRRHFGDADDENAGRGRR